MLWSLFIIEDTLTLYQMDLTGEAPNEVCDLMDGELDKFWADCKKPNDKVKCKCCDYCYAVAD